MNMKILVAAVLIMAAISVFFIYQRLQMPNMPANAHVCTEEEKDPTNYCLTVYEPVCGHAAVICSLNIPIIAPCPPGVQYQTYGNGCQACKDLSIVYYTPGVCQF